MCKLGFVKSTYLDSLPGDHDTGYPPPALLENSLVPRLAVTLLATIQAILSVRALPEVAHSVVMLYTIDVVDVLVRGKLPVDYLPCQPMGQHPLVEYAECHIS